MIPAKDGGRKQQDAPRGAPAPGMLALFVRDADNFFPFN